MRLTDYAITHNLTPFVSMQNHYNIAYREEEREMLPMLKHLGVGVIPWSPLARGATTRPLADTTDRAKTDPCVFELYHIYGSFTHSVPSTQLARLLPPGWLRWQRDREPVCDLLESLMPMSMIALDDSGSKNYQRNTAPVWLKYRWRGSLAKTVSHTGF